MDFFSKISRLGIESLSLKIICTDTNRATVIVVPHTTAKDKALEELKPISISGDVSEIDKEFFDRISTPVKEVAQLFDTVKAFEAQKEEIEKQTAVRKEQKAAIDKKIEALKKLMEKEEYQKVSKGIEELLILDPNNNFAVETKKELISKNSIIKMDL